MAQLDASILRAIAPLAGPDRRARQTEIINAVGPVLSSTLELASSPESALESLHAAKAMKAAEASNDDAHDRIAVIYHRNQITPWRRRISPA